MIVVYGLKHRLNPIKAQLSDAIHQCMMDVLQLPAGKRAHRFIPMEPEDFFYPEGRSDAYTVIEISMMAGRRPQTQKRLIKSLFGTLEDRLQLSPTDVEITIHEQPPHCWGFRGITGDEAKLDYEVKV